MQLGQLESNSKAFESDLEGNLHNQQKKKEYATLGWTRASLAQTWLRTGSAAPTGEIDKWAEPNCADAVLEKKSGEG